MTKVKDKDQKDAQLQLNFTAQSCSNGATDFPTARIISFIEKVKEMKSSKFNDTIKSILLHSPRL